jgi:hypothetical protein
VYYIQRQTEINLFKGDASRNQKKDIHYPQKSHRTRLDKKEDELESREEAVKLEKEKLLNMDHIIFYVPSWYLQNFHTLAMKHNMNYYYFDDYERILDFVNKNEQCALDKE